jgi:DNA-binding NtrC family response regulator
MTDADMPRVLVVDDEVQVCRSCEKILTREGYEVASVADGRQALERLESEPFDLVITDLRMAEMGGIELLESLRLRFPAVVPVVMTGYASVSSAVETMKVGAFDYLPKPFTPAEMTAVVSKAWARRQALRKAPPAEVPAPRTNSEFLSLKKQLRDQAIGELEREFVISALQRNGWNVTRAAADVGIQRQNFQALMRRHDIRTNHPL